MSSVPGGHNVLEEVCTLGHGTIPRTLYLAEDGFVEASNNGIGDIELDTAGFTFDEVINAEEFDPTAFGAHVQREFGGSRPTVVEDDHQSLGLYHLTPSNGLEVDPYLTTTYEDSYVTVQEPDDGYGRSNRRMEQNGEPTHVEYYLPEQSVGQPVENYQFYTAEMPMYCRQPDTSTMYEPMMKSGTRANKRARFRTNIRPKDQPQKKKIRHRSSLKKSAPINILKDAPHNMGMYGCEEYLLVRNIFLLSECS